MFKSKYFQACIWILLLFLIIFIGKQITFIFIPLVVLVETLFLPLFLSGILYYLLSPLVGLINIRRIPKTLAILIIYMGIGVVITLLVVFVGPVLQRQLVTLTDSIPDMIIDAQQRLEEFQASRFFLMFQEMGTFSPEEIAARLSESIGDILRYIGINITSMFNFLTNLVITLLIVPFILFYMLKEENVSENAMRFIPKQQHKEAKKILRDMHDTVGQYIQGQVLVSLCVGIIAFIGFLVIGLEYSLILALVAMLTNIVPFIGPIIGTIPALIVAAIHSPAMIVKTLILIVCIQQIESLFISPRIMGRKLSIHPIVIILLILFAGRLAGLVGIILAIPTYAVIKVIASHLHKLYQLRHAK